MTLPDRFRDVEELEEFMTRPSAALAEDLKSVPGDLLVLGIGGKMGPTLARLAKRADPSRRVIGVARFSEKGLREGLERHGIECIAADLLDREALQRLPDAANVVFMAGRKFGTEGAEEVTWAMNVLVPAWVAERYAASRIVAFSTGCVYPYVPVLDGGAVEETPAVPPAGIYAWTCLGREAMFRYWSEKRGTPGRLVRLNYAIDMRYGVLHDIARNILDERAVSVAMGHVNVIWQGDANAQALRALLHATVPATPLNVSGPETASVRALAREFGRRFGKEAIIVGEEQPTGWITSTRLAQSLFGYPEVPLARLVDWTAEWLLRGGASLGKPTHFDARDGRY